MVDTAFIQARIAAAGCTAGRFRDRSYRTGLVLQVLGAGIIAVLYPIESPYYSAGIMLFELGVLTAGICLRVTVSLIKALVLGVVLIGLPLQVLGLLAAPPEYAGSVILAGIVLVCIGAAGMAGKEAYCFAYREGWFLMVSLPLIVLVNLVFREHRIVNSLAFSALFLLLLSLAGKKLRQPLATSYLPGTSPSPSNREPVPGRPCSARVSPTSP